MPTIYEHTNFSILSIPKVGSANLQVWCNDNNITTTDKQPQDKPLYAFWRSPETRIPSGLATNINELVYSIHNLDSTYSWHYNQHKELYHDVIAQWCANPTHQPMSVAGVVCRGQHHCPMPTWLGGFTITPTHWIPLEQLSLFPKYLNNKYNTNFTTNIFGPKWTSSQDFWLPWRTFMDCCTPQGLEFIQHLIDKDTYRPKEMYPINANNNLSNPS